MLNFTFEFYQLIEDVEKTFSDQVSHGFYIFWVWNICNVAWKRKMNEIIIKKWLFFDIIIYQLDIEFGVNGLFPRQYFH